MKDDQHHGLGGFPDPDRPTGWVGAKPPRRNRDIGGNLVRAGEGISSAGTSMIKFGFWLLVIIFISIPCLLILIRSF